MKKKYKRRIRGPSHKIQNTDQSKPNHLHHTKRTIDKGIGRLRIQKGNISSKLDSTSLIVIHHIRITNQKSTELNNIEWNASKDDGTRSPQGGIEVK